MPILDRLFDKRYELETQKPKEEILVAIRGLIEAKRESKRPSFLFQNRDDSVIGIWGNKIEIKGVTTNDYKRISIGSIIIYLEETSTGTFIIAELKPYREQIQIPFFCLLFSDFISPFWFKTLMHFPDSQLQFACIIWSILTMGLCLIGLLIIKNILKNYLLNIVRYVGLGTEFPYL